MTDERLCGQGHVIDPGREVCARCGGAEVKEAPITEAGLETPVQTAPRKRAPRKAVAKRKAPAKKVAKKTSVRPRKAAKKRR